MSFDRFSRPSQFVGLGIRILVVGICLLALQDARLLAVPQNIIRGNQSLDKDDPIQAISDFRAALAAQPADAYLVQRLLDSAIAAKRPDMAAIFLHQLTSNYGWNSALYRSAANILTQQAEPEQASFYWRASLNGTKDDIPALKSLAADAINTQDWATATEMLTRLVNVDPTDTKSTYNLGLLLLPTDQKTALTYLERISTDPQSKADIVTIRAAIQRAGTNPAELQMQIGLTLIGLQAWPYAEHALSLALDQGSNAPATLAFLGVAQDQQGRDGWPAINRAYNAAPQDGMVNYAVALHWQLLSDLPKALTALTRAEAAQPNNPAIAAEIGHIYQIQGSLDNAAIWLNTAVVLAPENVGFRALLAKFYAVTQYDLGSAGLDSIHRIADQYPKVADAHTSLGWALYSKGQFEQARAEFQNALRLDAGDIRGHYYMAIIQEHDGDKESAIDSYLFVYRAPGDNPFKDMAGQALKRLGIPVDSQ